MKRAFRLVAPIAFLLLVGACAAAPETGGGPATSTSAQDPNLLTADAIRNFSSAGQAVQGLRSQWLRVRAAGGFNSASAGVRVYRDGVNAGGTEILNNIPTLEIESIRYYNGTTASQRWGLGHENGVIYVTSRNGRSADPAR